MAEAFPDNTVLCNFAAIDQLSVLHNWLGDRGRWSEAVAAEAAMSAGHLPVLAQVEKEGWLGEPISVTDQSAVTQIEGIRLHVFGGVRSRPLQHLGEAQTLWLLQNDEECAGAVWLSDDQDSLIFARQQGVRAIDTCDVMRHLIADGDLTNASAYALLEDMAASGRDGVRLPSRAQDLQT